MPIVILAGSNSTNFGITDIVKGLMKSEQIMLSKKEEILVIDSMTQNYM